MLSCLHRYSRKHQHWVYHVYQSRWKSHLFCKILEAYGQDGDPPSQPDKIIILILVEKRQYKWILLSAQSWQYCDRRKPEVRAMSYSYRMTSRVLHTAQYHWQHCTFQAFEQFGVLRMHNPDNKHPVSEFRAATVPKKKLAMCRYLLFAGWANVITGVILNCLLL